MLPKGYVLMNLIRCYSVVCLLMMIASSVIIVVKSFAAAKYIIPVTFNNLALTAACVLFIMSEISVCPEYLERCWPLWGPKSSLVATGLSEIVVASLLLGNFGDHLSGSEILGRKLYIFVIASGISTCVSGILTCCVSYLYRDRLTNTTARVMRSRNHRKQEAVKRMSRDFLPSSNMGDLENVQHIAVPARTYSTRGGPRPARYSTATSQAPGEDPSSVGWTSSETQLSVRDPVPDMPADRYAITPDIAGGSVTSRTTRGYYPSGIISDVVL